MNKTILIFSIALAFPIQAFSASNQAQMEKWLADFRQDKFTDALVLRDRSKWPARDTTIKKLESRAEALFVEAGPYNACRRAATHARQIWQRQIRLMNGSTQNYVEISAGYNDAWEGGAWYLTCRTAIEDGPDKNPGKVIDLTK